LSTESELAEPSFELDNLRALTGTIDS